MIVLSLLKRTGGVRIVPRSVSDSPLLLRAETMSVYLVSGIMLVRTNVSDGLPPITTWRTEEQPVIP